MNTVRISSWPQRGSMFMLVVLFLANERRSRSKYEGLRGADELKRAVTGCHASYSTLTQI